MVPSTIAWQTSRFRNKVGISGNDEAKLGVVLQLRVSVLCGSGKAFAEILNLRGPLIWTQRVHFKFGRSYGTGMRNSDQVIMGGYLGAGSPRGKRSNSKRLKWEAGTFGLNELIVLASIICPRYRDRSDSIRRPRPAVAFRDFTMACNFFAIRPKRTTWRPFTR